MSDQWQSTILSPEEIEALSAEPLTRMAKRVGISDSTMYNALKGKKVSGPVADRLRAAANGKVVTSTPSAPVRKVNFGNGRPGEDRLTLKERRELRVLLGRESLKKLSARIAVSEAALAHARDGKPIRGKTGQIVRAVLAGDVKPGAFSGLDVGPRTTATKAHLAPKAEPEPSSSRDVASFVEGQIIMAEFLSMSILNFLNGTDPRGPA